MPFSELLRRIWRIPVVALLGALIAFGGSYISDPTYASSTRLLIRGRDATFLTTTGEDLSSQPGVVDSSLAKTLVETQAGIATSREVAVAVVDALKLDKPKPDSGNVIDTVVGWFANAYRCTKAFVTHGMCKTPTVREAAIQSVQAGLVAGQLGSTTGEDAGQPNSYILELAGSGITPDEARRVTDAAADALIDVSRQRFRTEATAYAERLKGRLDAANEAVDAASAKLTDFKVANGISDLDVQIATGITSVDDLQSEVRSAQVDLDAARAQLASLNASIAATPATKQQTQDIQTGRSNNKITTNGSNSVYDDLVTQRTTVQAQVASLEARVSALNSAIATNGVNGSLTANQQQLVALTQQVKLAQDTQTKLNDQYQTAVGNLQSDTIELSRIDRAAAPTYPISPKRYLYLVLGLLIGAIAGSLLTWLAGRREGWLTPVDLREAPVLGEMVVTVPAAPSSEPVAVANGNGSGGGHAASTKPGAEYQ